MTEKSFREIKEAAESMTTATPRYTQSVRAPVSDTAKVNKDWVDKNSEKVLEETAAALDETPKANLIQAVEVEVRRDPAFRERVQKVMEDLDFMEHPEGPQG
jgi:hypothetical protein